MADYDYNKMKLTDEGTRFQHYSELLSLFEDSLEILKRIHPSYMTAKETYRLIDLSCAAKEIRNTLDVMGGFNPWNRGKLGEEIDRIPVNPKEIKDKK